MVRLLVSYLLGLDCVLSSSIATIKTAGNTAFPLHCDGPSEDRSRPLGAAAMFALSDFDGAAGGATAFLPASHRSGRTPGDITNLSELPGVEAVSTPAGSLLVWSEKTWHG